MKKQVNLPTKAVDNHDPILWILAQMTRLNLLFETTRGNNTEGRGEEFPSWVQLPTIQQPVNNQ